jgi:hypothetical protein
MEDKMKNVGIALVCCLCLCSVCAALSIEEIGKEARSCMMKIQNISALVEKGDEFSTNIKSEYAETVKQCVTLSSKVDSLRKSLVRREGGVSEIVNDCQSEEKAIDDILCC